MSSIKNTIGLALALAFWALMLVGVYFATVEFYQWVTKPEPKTSSISIEDRCEFVVKTNNFDSVSFSEPTGGNYKYEIYATPDGYLEVWKCNNF